MRVDSGESFLTRPIEWRAVWARARAMGAPSNWRTAWARGRAKWEALISRFGVLIAIALVPLWVFPVVLWCAGLEHWRMDLEMVDELHDPWFISWLATSSQVETMRWIVASPSATAAFGALACTGALLSLAFRKPAFCLLTIICLVVVWGLCLHFPLSWAPLDGALMTGLASGG